MNSSDYKNTIIDPAKIKQMIETVMSLKSNVFALVFMESRLLRMKEELENSGDTLSKEDFLAEIKEEHKGYNIYLFEQETRLKDICQNDKTFEIDFDAYLKGFDSETKDLLGIDKSNEDEKFLVKERIHLNGLRTFTLNF